MRYRLPGCASLTRATKAVWRGEQGFSGNPRSAAPFAVLANNPVARISEVHPGNAAVRDTCVGSASIQMVWPVADALSASRVRFAYPGYKGDVVEGGQGRSGNPRSAVPFPILAINPVARISEAHPGNAVVRDTCGGSERIEMVRPEADALSASRVRLAYPGYKGDVAGCAGALRKHASRSPVPGSRNQSCSPDKRSASGDA